MDKDLKQLIKHFDAAYEKAFRSSDPNDWMQAALIAHQIRDVIMNLEEKLND
jgi:hypothetical protein